jgi:FAD/FMN-containing dehydrogenase
MPARQRLDTILPPPILRPAPKLPVAASLMLCMQLYYWVDALSNGTKAAVGGTCPTVGTGGLIQGGGIGFLTRQHGLACDQVEEIHMVSPASCPVWLPSATTRARLSCSILPLFLASQGRVPTAQPGACTQSLELEGGLAAPAHVLASNAPSSDCLRGFHALLILQVDAAGKLVVANSSQNAQLLAATCGAGGGNMGASTRAAV